jgi:putative transposase
MLFKNKLSRNKHHTLPFRKTYNFLETKLLWNNIFMDGVYPYRTSTTCSRCGKKGERSGKEFDCKKCGKIHADLNASINIAKRGIKKWRKMLANSTHG